MSQLEGRHIDHNLRRKVESKDFPDRKETAIRDTDTALKFEALRKENEERTGNRGVDSTLKRAIDLAWAKINEIDAKDQEIQEIMEK